jgi:tetratricopeptide (TPR) repeat protein
MQAFLGERGDAFELSTELEAAYESAIDRAFSSALERTSRGHGWSQTVEEALALFKSQTKSGTGAPLVRTEELEEYESLLERCQEVRLADPKQMIEFASQAVFAAKRLDPGRYGSRLVADLRCRAEVELGNAYRAADRLDDAQRSLERAAEFYVEGTGDSVLGARLFDVQASLDADSRRFELACEALDAVYAFHLARGDQHLAGRALISKGLYTGYSGDPEESIRLLQSGLDLVDAKRDPSLVFVGVHNQAYFLVDCGRFREARALLWQNREDLARVSGRVTHLKLRWLEGRIHAGLDDLERAEEAFLEIKEGFQETDLPYKAALASLELAMVWLKEGRVEEARKLVAEAAEVFTALKIHREGLAAVLLLRKAFETRVATTALLERVIRFMTRAEDDPTVSFKAWFL